MNTVQETAISIKDVHITYRTVHAVSMRNLAHMSRVVVDHFEAVKGVSFDIPRGSIIGLVGRNGSGKSTLLRAVAGVFSPDSGEIDLHGNTVSLLAIGTGFQKELSGRENIYLSGLLMGMSKKQIDQHYDEIVRFSELEKFIDKPVSTYSSGMYSKLSFSIAVILQTDIVLVDEVLSVGDVAFRRKSSEKLRQLIARDDRTVIIVSHNSATIRELCDHVVWLNQGEIRMQGDTIPVMDAYDAYMAEVAAKMAAEEAMEAKPLTAAERATSLGSPIDQAKEDQRAAEETAEPADDPAAADAADSSAPVVDKETQAAEAKDRQFTKEKQS